MKTFAGLLASASVVAGHGYVTNATLGADNYVFYQPYTDPYTSPTPERVSRPIQGNGPVTDLTYADIQCGGDTANGVDGSSPANLTATVAAGASVDLYWTEWPTSHVGPTITYMAKCSDEDCTTFMPGSDAVWFKVQENGRDGTSDTWGATSVMPGGAGFVSYTVPECIEAGAYLVRHEIIALHAASTSGGAQFYPGCHQIKVTGGGSTSPSGLVAFPGAYSADDAGILYDAYQASTYTVPGPALFSCSGSSSSSGSSSGSASSAAATTAAATTTAATSSFATVTRSASSVPALAAQATSASSADDEGDDGCEPEETVTSTIASSQAQPTGSSASSGSDSGSDAGEDDGCDVEGDEPTTTGSGSYQAQPTGSAASGSDDEDCSAEEEQAFARRFSGRFARAL